MAEQSTPNTASGEAPEGAQLEGGAYEIIRNRLLNQGKDLRERLDQLNIARKDVFGSIEYQLIATDRISTENNCIARDIVAIGHQCIFGYNVHLGLRAEVALNDVFSVYKYEDQRFHADSLAMIRHERFEEDFRNLYKYYSKTVFSKFMVIGPFLYMVFRIGKSERDIKAFKWLIEGTTLSYVDARSDQEVRDPDQYEFQWKRAQRDMHREGQHPHVSIMDRIFVETIGGDLTIKVEDNTDTGKGIYEEEVSHKEQSLDDAEFFYADLGNIIVLRIKPYQERAYRYIAYNEKVQQARRIDSLADSCVLLPDDHGIIFSDGYYLQTGDFKRFDSDLQDMRFRERIASPNGEDYLYVFYNELSGTYILLSYNLIAQQVENPIICNGFCYFENGELCYFKTEEEPRKHHAIQIWQTPYVDADYEFPVHSESMLYKIGNKDIVRAMAESQEVLTLLGKDDSYAGLYLDLLKKTGDILDSYYWIHEADAAKLDEPLTGIRSSAQSAIEEFEKVVRIRKHTKAETERVKELAESLIRKIARTVFDEVDLYVETLAEIRTARGEVISLRELRYVDLELVAKLEEALVEQSEKLSQGCVEYLLMEDALRPYLNKVEEQKAAIEAVTKVTEANAVEEEIEKISSELELLIDIVGNLRIEDTTQTTRIIDHISEIYSDLNQVRALLRRKKKDLLGAEAVAEFGSQMKLLSQAIINYLDLSDSPERVEEYLTKLMVQVEELEGKFSEFDDFTEELNAKREEIYNAFESRKVSLIEARNKRASSLYRSADRILKGIQNRLSGFESANDINSYYASDLMIEKVRDLVDRLNELEDTVKAEDVQSRLKTLREDALRQLKDRKELFVDGANVIRMGRHNFSVNVQPLDLTVVRRSEGMYYHLTGTNFFEAISDADFLETRPVWDQDLISENKAVYRGEFLVYNFFQDLIREKGNAGVEAFFTQSPDTQLETIQTFMGPRYEEGYAKGIHDRDARLMLDALARLHEEIGLLRFLPEVRALARLFWGLLDAESRDSLSHRLKGAGEVLKVFPDTKEYGYLLEMMAEQVGAWCVETGLFPEELAKEAGAYLFYELARGERFIVSPNAFRIAKHFLDYLHNKLLIDTFWHSLAHLKEDPISRFELVRNWVGAYGHQEAEKGLEDYLDECAVLLFFEEKPDERAVMPVAVDVELDGLSGDHAVIEGGKYHLDYNRFMHRLQAYHDSVVPMFRRFTEMKKSLTQDFRHELRLDEFKPRVLSSFVRNKLIDEVYLPMIGDNLAKQIGAVGNQKRTDRMGMLLLISPPGYGKTTLMEYIANRLGLIFMKINGPAIGHQVLALDPQEAPNAAAREELEKLNLALEMGDNIMLYLDDIQHCNPEFLQKFISLSDAQRKIEGVYKGRSRTYDLRGKRVCVVMAGNPYTESGEKFQIPDMLANRADTYNLGDIIGDTEDAFKLSLIENALTSNPSLAKVAQKAHHDIYSFLKIAETGSREGLELEGNYSPEEVNEIVSVLEKMTVVRDVVLAVNQEYIRSAAQAHEYRTEPPFKLQGSYRDMNKLAEKVIPIMNEEELHTLLLTHYESEAQTLTTGAEANLLKFKELTGWMTADDQARWAEIKDTFGKKQKLLGLDQGDRLGQVIAQLGAFADGLEGIRTVLDRATGTGGGAVAGLAGLGGSEKAASGFGGAKDRESRKGEPDPWGRQYEL